MNGRADEVLRALDSLDAVDEQPDHAALDEVTDALERVADAVEAELDALRARVPHAAAGE